MIVICAGTTGYTATLDLRYHWMRQKRFQGSHLSNDEQAAAVNQMVMDRKVDPCLSHTFSFDEIGEAASADAREPPPLREYGRARERH